VSLPEFPWLHPDTDFRLTNSFPLGDDLLVSNSVQLVSERLAQFETDCDGLALHTTETAIGVVVEFAEHRFDIANDAIAVDIPEE
jgi:hypothetical protein